MTDDGPLAWARRTLLRRPAQQPVDEAKFQSWYRDWAGKAGIDPNPDHPAHKYDYRAAFRAGASPQVDPGDGLYHWPSEYKSDDHPNRFVNGVDTKKSKGKQPKLGSKENPVQGAPIRAKPPAHGATGKLSPAVQQALDSPFYQDTVKPWLGVDPEFVMGDAGRATKGFIDMNSQNRVHVNKGFKFDSPEDLDGTVFHEASHVADLSDSPAVGKIRDEMRTLFKEYAKKERAGESGLPPMDRRAENNLEHFSYTLEAAMQLLRRDRNVSDEFLLDVERTKELPGFAQAYRWLKSRGEEVERTRPFRHEAKGVVGAPPPWE
jgi:hypothetical protein